MRRYFILAALSLLSVLAHGQQKFTLKGKIDQLPDGEVIALLKDQGSFLTIIQKDTTHNGVFTISDTCSAPTRFMLIGMSDRFPSLFRSIWVSPGSTIQITGKDYLIKTWEIKSPVATQKEADSFIFASRDTWEIMQRLNIQENLLSSKAENASEDERKILRKTRDSLRGRYNEENVKVQQANMALLQKLPVTDPWIDMLSDFALSIRLDAKNQFRDQTLQLYKKLTPAQLETRVGVLIKNNLFPPPVVKTGEPMADTVLADPSSILHRLAEYKGKYLLLDFWSLGCGPCMMAMPELKSISDSLTGKLTVISINMDSSKEEWLKAAKRVNITWVNLNDKYGMGGLAARYGVLGIPHYVIVSPEGKILDAWTGYEQGEFVKKVGQFLP